MFVKRQVRTNVETYRSKLICHQC